MKNERNIEWYLDPTASVAIGQVSRAESETDKRARDLIKVLKAIVRLCGFELTELVQLKDTKSGREYKYEQRNVAGVHRCLRVGKGN